MQNGSSKPRETLKEFLRKRVESHPGISIQKLTGHLSQLPVEIRKTYPHDTNSIRRVLEQFPEIFVIRNHDQVHLTTSESSGKPKGASSFAGGSKDQTTSLTGVKGKVYRLFETYGFASVQHPINTCVYFSLHSFENGQHSSLLSSGLQLGEGVVLDAEVGPNDLKIKFRASRVTRIKGGNVATPSDLSSPAPQTSALTSLVNRTGVIETLKDEFGFIKLEKENECAFFHADQIARHLRTAVPALPEILAVGDKITFDADPNKKTTARAKWVVTTIHSITNLPPCHLGSETEEKKQACLRIRVHRTASTQTGQEATTVDHPSRRHALKLHCFRHQGEVTEIAPFPMTSVENELRRVARIIAKKMFAVQQQEQLAKGLVRNVGTQTTEHGVHFIP
ncbi:hypothetical protein HPB51_027805 [Rhipicephalus microplus]|uniref:Egal-1 winged helix domain-containing protein n=1 Tax=Rhipicephalus microplus TaxID=6941 RepID=A0A9J6CZ35_RHIMP|nr:hypothetical protein HPB51_027805 [Rhipicephalus microplus]